MSVRRRAYAAKLACSHASPSCAEWAKAQGLGVLVLNPNHRDTRSETHVVEAWDECVAPAAAQHVIMVAHSYGGVCLGSLLEARRDAVTARLRGVALSDSVHGRSVERLPAAQRDFWVQHCVNWVTSRDPLDTPVRAAVHKPPKTDGGDTDRSDSDAGGSLSDDSEEEEEEEDEAPQRCVCMLLIAPARCAEALLRAASARHAHFGHRRGATRRAFPRATRRTSRRARHAARARVRFSFASCRTRAGCRRTQPREGQKRSVCPPSSPRLVHFLLWLQRNKPQERDDTPELRGRTRASAEAHTQAAATSRVRTPSPASDPALCVKARAVYARYANTPASASAPQSTPTRRKASSKRALLACAAQLPPGPHR